METEKDAKIIMKKKNKIFENLKNTENNNDISLAN